MRKGKPADTNAFPRALPLLAVAAALLGLVLLDGVAGDTLTWDADPGTPGAQDGGGTWDTTATNWLGSGGNTSWNSGTPDQAIFGAGGSGSYAVALGAGITADRVTFNAGASYTLTGNMLSLSGSNYITVNQDATFACPFQADGSAWNKNGPGRLTLTVASPTLTRYVNLSAGILNLRNDLAAGTQYIHAFGTGAVEVQDNIRVANVLYVGNTNPTDTLVDLLGVSGDNEWAGTVYIHDTHPYAIIGVNPGSTLTISGLISRRNLAVGTLTKVGEGTLVITHDNNFVAPTYLQAGVTNIRASAALGTTDAGTTVAAGAALQIQGNINVGAESLALSGDGIGGTGALRNMSGDNGWGGPVTLSGTVAVGVDAGSLTVSGAIGGGALTKVGAGTLVLSGANTYTGRTTVIQGTLKLDGGSNRINPAGTLWVGNSAYTLGPTFDLNGQDQSFQGWSRLAGGSTVLLSGGATLTMSSADIWGGSYMSGSGRFVKTSSGLITFGATATHTGGTVINDGRLAFYGGSNRLPTTGDVQVTGNGILDLSYYVYTNSTQTIDELSGNGTVRLSGVNFVVGNGGGSSEFSGSIVDGLATDPNGQTFAIGRLTKVGAGTQVLSGTNTYTGNTTVSDGTLIAAKTAALPGYNAPGKVSTTGSGTTLVGTTLAVRAGAAGEWTSPDIDTLLTNAVFAAGSKLGIEVTAGNTFEHASAMGGAQGLVKLGDGTLTLSAANTYTGPTWVVDGTLKLDGGSNRINPAGSLWVGLSPNPFSPVFDLNGQDQTFQGTSRVTEGSTVLLSGGAALTLYSGDIRGSSYVSGSGSLVKDGTGDLAFGSGAGATYTGGTFIKGGSLSLYAYNDSLPNTGDVDIASGASLRLRYPSHTFNSNLQQTVGRLTGAGEVWLNKGTLVVGNGDGSSTFSGAIVDGLPFTGFDAVGGVKKVGTGTWTLEGNSSYTWATTVSAGTLLVNGSIAASSGVTVVSGATLGGTGRVPAIGGGGLVSPGASPGILTAVSVDPSPAQGGLDFAFEFTATSPAGPNYADAGASLNDVLRLTDPSAPFAGALGAGNEVDVYIDVADLKVGDVLRGGFYTDLGADFLSSIDGADFHFFVAGAGGPVSFNGKDYFALDDYLAVSGLSVSTVPELAHFAAGDVQGYVMQLTAVPEPAAVVLMLLGSLPVALGCRRRRARSARPGAEGASLAP